MLNEGMLTNGADSWLIYSPGHRSRRWRPTGFLCAAWQGVRVMAARGPLVALAETLAEALLRNGPFLASYLGVSGYEDAVPDLSPQARAAWRDSLVDVLIRCERLERDAAGLDDQVLLGAVRGHAAQALAAVDSRVEEFSVAAVPMGGLPFMLLVMARASVTDASSASAVLSRCQRIPWAASVHATRIRAIMSGVLTSGSPVLGCFLPTYSGRGMSAGT